ncbi:hypothetical protein ABZ891_26455 [Streptomyces sp. NPDC047023]|uniref:hypothetical protein n=1 Tax=Streptomyces sp. NPDC047023 TaxID=3155139 RepID=UPI0033E7D3BF
MDPVLGHAACRWNWTTHRKWLRRWPPGWAHPWQLTLIVFAVLAPLPPAVDYSALVDGARLGYGAIIGATTAVVALPLALHRHRNAFEAASTLGGVALTVWILYTWPAGTWTFALSVPLMRAAASADPRRRPILAPLLLTAGTLLAGAVVAWPGFWWRL